MKKTDTAIVDRIEGQVAVLLIGEVEEEWHLDRSSFPEDLTEGDGLMITVDMASRKILSVVKEQKRIELTKERIGEKVASLKKKKKSQYKKK